MANIYGVVTMCQILYNNLQIGYLSLTTTVQNVIPVLQMGNLKSRTDQQLAQDDTAVSGGIRT